jgi:Fels-1 Prophage Protein-like
MRVVLAQLGLCVALAACDTPRLSVSSGGAGAWRAPAGPLYRTERDVWLGLPGYGSSRRPAVACDSFGRCWQLGPYDRFARGYVERRDARPPGWAESLPGSAWMQDRFLRPRSDVVCDRASRICYKEGHVDKSDTEGIFGGRAGQRADALRDRFGTARLFVPERGVACDRENRVCLEDGDADRRLTRRYFGRGAARAIDEERRRDDDGRSSRRSSKRKSR